MPPPRSDPLDALQALVVVLDSDGRILRWNRACSDLTGYALEEVRGRPFRTAPLVSGDSVSLQQRLHHMAKGELPRRFESWCTTKRGIRRRIAWSCTSSSGAAGELEQVVVSGIDRTETWSTPSDLERNRRDEHILADVGSILTRSLDSEEALVGLAELAVRSFADLCIVDAVDDHGNMRRIDVACRRPEWHESAEALRAPRIDASPPDLLATVLRTSAPVLVSEVTPRFLESCARDEAQLSALRLLAPTSFLGVPLVARDRLLGAIGFLRITSQPPYGEADLELSEALARRAALAADNALLRRLTRRAIEARKRLLAGAAHDLRRPLNSLSVALRILERNLPPGEQGKMARQWSDTVSGSVFRATHLVTELLDVTGISARRHRD